MGLSKLSHVELTWYHGPYEEPYQSARLIHQMKLEWQPGQYYNIQDPSFCRLTINALFASKWIDRRGRRVGRI